MESTALTPKIIDIVKAGSAKNTAVGRRLNMSNSVERQAYVSRVVFGIVMLMATRRAMLMDFLIILGCSAEYIKARVPKYRA